MEISRLRAVIRATVQGGCKITSQGEQCLCPLCDLDRIAAALGWYRDYAAALNRDLRGNKTDAVMASMTALSLDAGKRAECILEPEP